MAKFVEMTTSAGTLRIELDDAKAPATVANFLDYVGKGHYDGTIFHRVINGFMIQGGGFDPQMNQKATRAPVKNEAQRALDKGVRNAPGTLAMAMLCAATLARASSTPMDSRTASSMSPMSVLMTTSLDGRIKARLATPSADVREPVWGPFLNR